MEKSIKSIALNFGSYLGVFLILITVAIYAINLNLMANMYLGLGMIALIIGVGIFATSKVKQGLNGFISFKDAFSAYFITTVLGVVISSIFSFILFSFIDPDAAEEIKKITIEATINTMKGFNAPVEVIAASVEEMEKTDQFSLGSTAQSLVFGSLFQAVIGLIVGAIMKKSNPDE